MTRQLPGHEAKGLILPIDPVVSEYVIAGMTSAGPSISWYDVVGFAPLGQDDMGDSAMGEVRSGRPVFRDEDGVLRYCADIWDGEVRPGGFRSLGAKANRLLTDDVIVAKLAERHA